MYVICGKMVLVNIFISAVPTSTLGIWLQKGTNSFHPESNSNNSMFYFGMNSIKILATDWSAI